MTTVKLELEGADVLAKKLKTLSSAVSSSIAKDAVDEGGAVIQFHAQLNARDVFSDRQRGQLRNSIRVESHTIGNGAEAEIGPHVIYGRIQELGGTIRPVHKRVLHWTDPVTGEDIFAKQVTLPARPYLRPAVEENISKISDAMSRTIEDGINNAI